MSDLLTFFNLASDQTRLRLIILLSQDELCVCQLCGILNLSQPKVSKHLAKLRAAKYVKTNQKGKFIFYSLNIKNTIITNMIKDIFLHIDEYPYLKEDNSRLAKKDTFLTICTCTTK